MVLFAVVISACAFAFGALAVLLPAVLEASGISRGEAVFLASVKGFAQFFGRVCEIRYGGNLGILTVGRFAVACLPLSFAFLLFGGGGFAMALVFTLLFGVSNGLLTIVRGAVPLVLFGPVGYGAVLGLLATPYLIMNASAPVLLAALVEQTQLRRRGMGAAGLWRRGRGRHGDHGGVVPGAAAAAVLMAVRVCAAAAIPRPASRPRPRGRSGSGSRWWRPAPSPPAR